MDTLEEDLNITENCIRSRVCDMVYLCGTEEANLVFDRLVVDPVLVRFLGGFLSVYGHVQRCYLAGFEVQILYINCTKTCN